MENNLSSNELTYLAARKELEAILNDLEAGEPDTDVLLEKVKRATEIITFCKEKLTKTDTELQEVLEKLK